MAQVNPSCSDPEIKSFQDAVNCDSTVDQGIKRGAALCNIIAALAREKQLLRQRIMELESICPRKIKSPDGKVYVWNCPPELIPLTSC